MNRTSRLLASAAVLGMLAGPVISCAQQNGSGTTVSQVTPAQVAGWISAEADGLKVVVAAIPNAPASVTQALADLSAVAASVSSTDLPTQAILDRVQADVEGVLQVVQPLAPATVQPYISAAAVLLPWIISALNAPKALSARTYSAAAKQPMSRDQAVAVLKAARAP